MRWKRVPRLEEIAPQARCALKPCLVANCGGVMKIDRRGSRSSSQLESTAGSARCRASSCAGFPLSRNFRALYLRPSKAAHPPGPAAATENQFLLIGRHRGACLLR